MEVQEMTGVSAWMRRVRGALPRCEHDWSYPYAVRFDGSGKARTMEWRCKRCGRRQWGSAF